MRFFIYLVVGIVGLFALGTIVLSIREHLIRRKRKDDKPEDFINHFVNKGFSESLALSVYDHLQNWMGSNGFPVRPQDNLANIYGIDDNLEDLIIEIAEANNLVVPPEPDPWPEPIATVEDLVRLIASFPGKDF